MFFKKKEPKVWQHYVFVAKKDKSGRIRYKAYVDGKLCKEEFTLDFWIDKSKKDLSLDGIRGLKRIEKIKNFFRNLFKR